MSRPYSRNACILGRGLPSTGTICLTPAAQSPLHSFGGRADASIGDQRRETDEVLDAERAAAGGHDHEDVGLGGVGPRRWQRLHRAVLVEEEGPVLTPGLAHSDEHELPPPPGMERVRHPDGSLATVGIEWG